MAGGRYPNPGDILEMGVPTGILDWASAWKEGPHGDRKAGPTPEEIAEGWVFFKFPDTWPNNEKQWSDLGWGSVGFSGIIPGTITRVPVWYRWVLGTASTSAPPAPPPPPEALPVLSSADPTWGQVIPQSFGTRRVNGVPIWLGTVRRVADTGNVGAVDFAMAFGNTARPKSSPRLTQLTRLWADGLLVYDALSTTSPAIAPGLSVTFYPGLPDAQPDPTIKAAMGDATPAFRDLYYVVLHNFPLKSGTSKVPSIRAELVDQPSFQTPTLEEFTVLAPPKSITPYGVVMDFDTNTMYGVSDWFLTQPHVLHAFDVTTETEVSRVNIDGSLLTAAPQDPPNQFNYMAIDWWHVYDKYNFLTHSQSGSALSNSMRINSMRVDSGVVIATYGNESNSLTSGINTSVFSEHADFFRFRAWGSTIHGLLLGTINPANEVVVLSYRRQEKAASPTNAVASDRCGVLSAGDAFHLGFETLYSAGSTINAVCAYPMLDRPELEAAYKVSTLDTQDACLLYATGSQIFCVDGGLLADASSTSWATTNAQRALYDFGTLTPKSIFIDPTTGCIMVMALDGLGDGLLYKLKPTFVLGRQGVALQSVSVEYSTALSGVNILPQEMALRTQRLDGGSFAYFSGNDLVLVSLGTGQEIYRQLQPTTSSDRFVYDSVTQSMIIPVGTGTPGLVSRENIISGSSTLVPVTDFLGWCGLRLGYAGGDISNDGHVTETLIGGNITTPTTVRQAMTTVSAMYGTSSVEFGGKLKFVRPLPGDSATLSAVFSNEDLSRSTEGNMDSLSTATLAADEMPADVVVGYLDPANDYNLNAQVYRRVRFPFQTAKSQTAARFEAPIVINASDAMSIAGRLVLSSFAQGSTFEYRLPHRYVNLLPGDVIGLLEDDKVTIGELSQIQQVQYNGDWSLSLKGIRWSLSDVLVIAADTPPGRVSQQLQGPSDSIAFAFDVPYLDPVTDVVPGSANVYTGAGTLGQSWWTAAQISRSLDSSTDKLYLTDIPIPYGICAETLPTSEALGNTFSFDRDTVLNISGRAIRSASMVTVSEEHCRAGYNQALIGAPGRWELVFFQTVTAVSANHFRLSGLLRGRRGTNVHCDDHEAADQFILVKSNNVKTNLRGDHINVKYRGKQVAYYAVGANTLRPSLPTQFSFEAASEKPWTVRRVRAKLGSEANVVGATSYLNECGTGDRRELITVIGEYNIALGNLGADGGFAPTDKVADWSPWNVIDGSTVNSAAHTTYMFDGQTNAMLTFDFHPSGFKQVIDEFTVTQSNPDPLGTFDWEASDDGVTWTTLAAGLTTINGIHSYVNAVGYWFYRFRQTGSTTSSSPGFKEIEFKSMAVANANDVIISWLRRDRLQPSALFVTDDLPLSETSELYQVDVVLLNAVNPTSTIKSLPLTVGNRAVYTATEQTADGFTPPLANISVRVSQLGAGTDTPSKLGYSNVKTVEVT